MKTEIIQVHSEFPELDQLARCAQVVRKGGLVIFPTETVYGIAADFSNDQAIQRLRDVKQRAEDKPFSLMISQVGLISNYTTFDDPILYKLVGTYWPGPLTVVVPSKRDGEGTIGIRIPDHPVAQYFLNECLCPIAAPSANIEGHPPPRTCAEALAELDGLVDCALDAGPAKHGQGSTVVSLMDEQPTILREGIISRDEINHTVGQKNILFICTGNSCRSVMAEYLLRDLVQERNDVLVASAGTSVFLRSTASADTISVLREEGIDATQHISQPVSTVLLKQADLIFVMTRQHRTQILDRVPEVESRVYLLKEFIPTAIDQDISDPMGQSYPAYKSCVGQIKEAIMKIQGLV